MSKTLRNFLVVAATATLALSSGAQAPTTPPANRPAGTAASGPVPAMPMAGGMAHMDERMKAMGAMHEKMMAAKTPAARQALMAEQMKLMQDGMSMMGGMAGMGPAGGDIAARQQAMEKRMAMMQSMMQMMVDRMQAMPPASK